MENAGLTKGFGDVGKRRKGAIICSLRSMNPDVGKNINIKTNINIKSIYQYQYKYQYQYLYQYQY